MTYVALRSRRWPQQDRRRRRNRALLAVSVGALGLVGARLSGWGEGLPQERPAEPSRVAVAAEPAVRPLPAAYAWMLDPTPALGNSGHAVALPLASDFQRFATASVASPATMAQAESPAEPAIPAARIAATPAALPERVALATPLATPLPVRRPAEFRRGPVSTPVAVTARLTRRPAMPSTQSVFRAAGVEEPSLFDRLFGDAPAPTALGYAAVETAPDAIPSRQRLVPAPMAGAGIAVYDISASRVTLPSGEVLEAHSGLGPAQDNPRHVHLTMRGATPPGTYDLREREALFHGVRAIRLNPVGGPAAIHGRVGLLAHTYMLGPSGASNGCVVFRDYNRFLQAFLRGEVQRLVVVAGNGQDGPPASGRRYGMADRSQNGG
ncbi:DUF2778 domain-containing protein [Methylobacterium gossipiicola]|uniref:Tlde1 domain-containing protein n=1 Tax=Methylobacterium gossipiicola TaxID=582675 RepID=A0A1I2U149_9HYPH|nr:DUF2778 domain-containing protein [Methylobacterium gossipiicola]SFG70862.1 Protein of unknown function [Methylobacterium gossipiicola]